MEILNKLFYIINIIDLPKDKFFDPSIHQTDPLAQQIMSLGIAGAFLIIAITIAIYFIKKK
jgi:hypothetical protein